MATILVTGANGQVGNELQFLAKDFPQFSFLFTDAKELDITDAESVENFFHDNHISYCLNCAAYTAVDKAEGDSALCELINVVGTANLAANCSIQNIPLIQLSTDYVYHNAQNTPFKEDDETNPQSVYAVTKLQGDLAALELNSQSIVIRTSWVYSTFGHNFVKTMLRLGKERPSLSVVFDQIGTPTYARDLAHAMLSIVDKIHNASVEPSLAYGIFHYSNEGVTSWYDFAKAIFEIENIQNDLKPIESSAYPTPAKRPPFSVLNKQKIKDTFGISIPHWRDSLSNCLEALEKGV